MMDSFGVIQQQLYPVASSFVLALVGSAGGLLYGYNIGVVSGITSYMTPHYKLSKLEEGLVSAFFLAGAMIGSFAGGVLCNRFGRKIPLAIVGIIGTLGSSGGAIFPFFEVILGARTLVGLSVGLGSSVCPLYVNELAPESRRGMLSSTFQLSITFGIVVAYLAAYLLRDITDAGIVTPTAAMNVANYGLLMHLGTAISVWCVVLALFIPESAVWLRQRAGDGKPEINSSETDSLLRHSLVGDIRGGWSGLFSKHYRRLLATGVVMAVMVALTGINAIFFYAPTIFEGTGFATEKDLMTLLLGVFNFLCTIVAVAIVDRVSHKSLLLFGLTLQASSLGLLGIAVQWINGTVGHWIAFVCTFLNVLGFAVGPGIVFWILVVQIFPESIRSQGSSVINLLQWTENLILTLVYPLVVDAVPIQYTFWFFAVISIITCVLLSALLPGRKKFADLDSLPE